MAKARSGTLTVCHAAALRPRPLARHHRHLRPAGAAQQHRSRAPRRPARLHPLLGGRASQHAEHRELGARHHDRADRGGDRASARRLRRRDAAEPRAAPGRRALQGAGRPVSRPHRSRPRPRAGHRSGDLLRAAAAAGRSRRRRFPRPLPGAAGVRAAAVSGEPSVPQGQRHAGRRAAAAALSARLERLQRAACRPCRRGLFLRASFFRFRSGRADDDLSRAVQAVGDAGQAAGDPRAARGLRRHRGRGRAARDLGRSRTSRCGGRAATSRSRARRKPRRTAIRRPTAR